MNQAIANPVIVNGHNGIQFISPNEKKQISITETHIYGQSMASFWFWLCFCSHSLIGEMCRSCSITIFQRFGQISFRVKLTFLLDGVFVLFFD